MLLNFDTISNEEIIEFSWFTIKIKPELPFATHISNIHSNANLIDQKHKYSSTSL